MSVMAKRRRGRGPIFSKVQNAALRTALLALTARFPSQRSLGFALGLAQQNAGRLINDRRAGFSYVTACAVARLSGFSGVDAFFEANGLPVPGVEDSQLHALEPTG